MATDEEIANKLYPGLPGGSSDDAVRTPGPVRTLEELAEIIYPPPKPKYAPVDATGQVGDVIRDKDSNIMHGGDALVQYSDFRAFVAYNKRGLENAALRGITFGDFPLGDSNMRGADLGGSSFRRGVLRGSDLSGANLHNVDLSDCDLTGVDLTGATIDNTTNIAGAKMEGAKYDYETMKRAAGADLAHGLHMNRKPKK